MKIIECQRDQFVLKEGVSYLNGAYMTPMLRAGKRAVEKRLIQMEDPSYFNADTFFEFPDELRRLYGDIIGAEDESRIALIPSVSYGIANVVRQIKPIAGSNIVLNHEQFPSNYYSWKRLADDFGCEIRMVKPPNESVDRGKKWNEALLNAIDAKTAAVSIAPLFHSDGTLFDLKTIGEKAKNEGAVFVVDGTQAIGAMPFDVKSIGADAVVCASYKWLLGTLGSGTAYYGDFFDEGIPIEESWMAHEGYRDFANLAHYKPALLPKGVRYSSGEYHGLLNLPMLLEGARQLVEWGSGTVSNYARHLFTPYEDKLRSMGCILEDRKYRAPHLFGLRFSVPVDIDKLKARLWEEQVITSVRRDALRVSVSVYNDSDDLERLVRILKATFNEP